MREYLFFLDTEATGLPQKWDASYSMSANWPSAVQISWIIYKKDGTLIKTENHYISDSDVELHASAIKIHGITRTYLNEHGTQRKLVMQHLAHDLVQYQPLVIGHFMEFDYHIASADFYRSGIENPLETLPSYCTMLASKCYVRDPSIDHLRLAQLYSVLFDKTLENSHNALSDAQATADCFFELMRRNVITEDKINLFQTRSKKPKVPSKFPWLLSLVILLVLTTLLTLWV